MNTKANELADALSRGQMLRFRRLGPHMDVEPSEIKAELWPLSQLWDKIMMF